MPKTIEEVQQKIIQDVDALTKEFAEYQKDGLKADEVIKFILEAATKLVETVEDAGGIPGAQKKELVISSVKDIYWKINPNIPFLPDVVETPLEKWLLDLALPPFIDFIVGTFEKKGIFE